MELRLVLVTAVTLGCSGDPTAGGPDADPFAPDANPLTPDASRDTFTSCRGRAFTPAATESWRHSTLTPLTLAAGDPNHSAQDVIVKPGAERNLVAKFTYGTISKDLEDEDVRIWIDDCAGWSELGDFTTNSDGRITAAVPAALAIGVYEARFQVLGDASMTTSFLWILPAGTHLVLTDIDGTMTASDSELFEQMLDGSHVPVPYPAAVELIEAHADRRWVPVFLTGRPYWLQPRTRDWLADLDFPAGPLHVTDSNSEALPVESGVGAFKRAWIEGLLDEGYLIDFAYGNAATDVYAYLEAGLPPEDVWIIGPHGGEDGTHAATGTWQPRLDEVLLLPEQPQPFDW